MNNDFKVDVVDNVLKVDINKLKSQICLLFINQKCFQNIFIYLGSRANSGIHFSEKNDIGVTFPTRIILGKIIESMKIKKKIS